MKNILLSLLIVFATQNVFAQQETQKKNIKADFDQYINFIIKKDFKQCVKFMPPKVFDIIPEKQFIQLMDQTMNNPGIEFNMGDYTITSLKDIEVIEDKHYALMTYSMDIHMKYIWSKMEGMTDDDEAPSSELMLLTLQEQFGEGNVSYNEKTDFYKVLSNKKVAAISENGTNNWKFAVLDKGQLRLAKMFLPEKIIEQASEE